MIEHPILEQLRQLKFHGMVQALQEQLDNDTYQTLAFEERLALLLEREKIERENRQYTARLRKATLKHVVAIPDVRYDAARNLSKSVVLKLSEGRYLHKKYNLLITGKTGTGKTFLACAFAEQACKQGFKVKYWRISRLLHALVVARGDGSYTRLLKQLAQINLLILDDWGIEPLTDTGRRDLLELLDDRHQKASTCVTSQLPIKHWYEYIGDPTLADAILDRLIHNGHKIQLKGPSLREDLTELEDEA